MNKSYNYKIISTKKLLNSFLGANFPGDNFPCGYFPECNFPGGGQFSKGKFLEGNFPRSVFPWGIFLDTFSKVKVINKSGKIVAQHKLSFSVLLQTLWIKMK